MGKEGGGGCAVGLQWLCVQTQGTLGTSLDTLLIVLIIAVGVFSDDVCGIEFVPW